jgi:hypothetical protein
MKLSQAVVLDLVQNINLPYLPSVSEPHMIEFLRKCFKRKIRLLSIGSLFVVLNRQEAFPSDFKTDVFNFLFLSGDDRLDVLNPQEPSFAQIALRVYSSLGHRSHAFFFIGDIGGGKSRCFKEFASHLILLSSLCRTDRKGCRPSPLPPPCPQPSAPKPSEAELKLFDQVNTILESFGHCQTLGNYRSSRYSKTITLSFTERGALEAINVRCHHLEHTRVAVSRREEQNGETNFKIFFDIFDDIFFADQATNKYGIENLTSFRYTSQRPRAFAQTGKSSFKSLVAALQTLGGIPKTMQTVCVFNILAAILHLGEIEIDPNSSAGDSISFSSGPLLHLVSSTSSLTLFSSSDPKSLGHQSRVLKLLGLTLTPLLTAVGKKSLRVAGSVVETNLEFAEARVARDSLACHLYAALFRWVLSKINVGLISQLPINLAPTPGPSPAPQSTDSSAPRTCSLHDLMAFETVEHNQLEHLCVNYANERLVHHLHQTIFVHERNQFESDGFTVPDLSYPDNTQVLRTIDNRTNGLFLLSEEQLRLKGSTDQKLAQFFYAQHSSNKVFSAAKAEQKNSEFLLRHYGGPVKYEIVGFSARNREDPSAEILSALKASSVEFIREELAFHCERATGGSRLSLTSSSSSIQETSEPTEAVSLPSPLPSPQVREKRPSLVKSRSAAFIADPDKSPGRGLLSRSASMVSRNGSLRAQGKTLTQATAAFMNEIMTETRASKSHFFLCLKLNNSYDPTTFDAVVVARQLRPYQTLEILSFYLQTNHPYQMSTSQFVNRFSAIALITVRESAPLQRYLQDLITCRGRCGKSGREGDDHEADDLWKELAETLVQLIPQLPELDQECENIRDKATQSEGTITEAAMRGVRVGHHTVYLSTLSHHYLTGALQLAVRLFGLRVWRFYHSHRFSEDQKVAGEKIGQIMKRFLVRRQERKQTARLATIAMTQLALKRLRERKAKAKALEVEKAEPEATPVVAEIPQSLLSTSPPPTPLSDSVVPKPEELEPPPQSLSVRDSHSGDTTSASAPDNPPMGQTDSPATLALLQEQQDLIRSLRDENVSLKRQLITLSSMLANTPPRSPPPNPPERVQERIMQSSVQFATPPTQPSPASQGYKPSRKVLQTQSSSLETFSVESVYGGELSKDLEPSVTELQPEYEVFVERTLKSLREDISYLLVRE